MVRLIFEKELMYICILYITFISFYILRHTIAQSMTK